LIFSEVSQTQNRFVEELLDLPQAFFQRAGNQILRAVGFSFLKGTGMEALSYGQGVQQGLSQLQTVPNTITCLRAAGVALRAVQV